MAKVKVMLDENAYGLLKKRPRGPFMFGIRKKHGMHIMESISTALIWKNIDDLTFFRNILSSGGMKNEISINGVSDAIV